MDSRYSPWEGEVVENCLVLQVEGDIKPIPAICQQKMTHSGVMCCCSDFDNSELLHLPYSNEAKGGDVAACLLTTCGVCHRTA